MKNNFFVSVAFGALILVGTPLGLSLTVSSAAAAHHEMGHHEEEAMGVDYAAILAAEDRSEADKARDASRHPVEVLTLMNLQPGQMVLDVGAGSGYYSEIFARVLGNDGGMVHAINNPHTAERYANAITAINGRAENLTSGKLFPEVTEFADITAHKPADAVFMGQMYHEIIVQGMDAAKVNAAIFNALKPGGLYVIEIHNAVAGSGAEASNTYHRADPDLVREQVMAVGFELVEENTSILGNPEDPKTVGVFDPSVRGKTDRTVFIFKRPE